MASIENRSENGTVKTVPYGWDVKVSTYKTFPWGKVAFCVSKWRMRAGAHAGAPLQLRFCK